ncbi:rhomboid family intramembrane serine protease [Flavobacterium covae]|uniref:rhomboid family intramembrane serine protease n=1 Tax=Flavobacterium TaxID=237 RepID=UPI0007C1D4C3|nr:MULTISPECIES: rhomboid family intramembrane serine protease [Flavobacterium]AND64550.1 rhomboid family intramembrane serine protease [Flavobacterium covae]MCH4829116.1 rhomboid family intramembrane serine protease [Flavobacterium columnare]MCH4833892.1 rhomboid family intramembrane serine protease [Flavobacterium columnare]OWP86596.1 rhomboid family intramembrane serine protease [Flavobacterium covae]
MKESEFKFTPSVVLLPLYFVLCLWIVFWVEKEFKINLTEYGIYPRSLAGLRGVLFSPFLHGDIGHLFNNSLPLLFLLACLRYFYREHSSLVLWLGLLLSGLGTWLIGRENYHIGASGLVYVLASFIFFKGIQTGYYRLVALSFTVILLYGGMIWYIFPSVEEHISWEAHLSGFLVGLVFSWLYDAPVYQKTLIYDWQEPNYDSKKDPFMKHFDEDGNFVSSSKMRQIELEKWIYFVSNLPVMYEVKKPDETSGNNYN